MKKSKIIFYVGSVLLALAVLFAITAFSFIGIRKFYWQQSQRDATAAQDAGQKWRKLEGDSSDWQNIEREYATFRRDYLLLETDFALLRSDIETMINTNGLQRKSLTYSPNELQQLQLKFYKMTLVLTGEYPNLKKFLFDLEHQKRMVLVAQVALSQEKNQIAAIVELEAYFAE